MWRISALDREGREVGRFELAAGELTIGRDADRQLVLPSASVSRRHARLVIDGGQPCIVDEGSANGVIVDGVRITQPTFVSAETRIDLAEFRLAIEPLMGGVEAMPPPPRQPRVTPVPGVVQSSLPPMRLVAEGGPYDGRVFELRAAEIAVGRAVDNDVVLDDPSLSRKHGKIHRRGLGDLEVEDLGSSNGTFINGRKIGRGAAKAGDVVRFGELSFRVEGDTIAGTSAVFADIPRAQLYALIGGGAATLILFIVMIVVLAHKPAPVQAPGKDAIARIAHQADAHIRQGRTLLNDHKYGEAKSELDQALELDPANADARRLRALSVAAPDDDKTASAGQRKIAIGDKKALSDALQLLDMTTDGTPGQLKLKQRLVPALVSFANSQCSQRNYGDCAWALCRAWEVAPSDGKPDAATVRLLHEAERKIRDRSYVRCRATP